MGGGAVDNLQETTKITRLKTVVKRTETGGDVKSGAGNETRTRDPDLGKVVLYQLSYSRINAAC